MTYFIDALREIFVWTVEVDDGLTVEFQCLAQGHLDTCARRNQELNHYLQGL